MHALHRRLSVMKDGPRHEPRPWEGFLFFQHNPSYTGLFHSTGTGRVNACDGWGMAGLLTCLPLAEDLAYSGMLEAVPGKTGREF